MTSWLIPVCLREMGVQSQSTLPGVVVNRMLERIHREGPTASNPFEGDKDLIDLRKQVAAFLIKVGVEGGKGVAIHVHHASHCSLALDETNTAVATFHLLEAYGDGFADAQARDPHQEDEGTIPPGRKLRKERLQILLGNDRWQTIGLPAIQV
jgi:hypothetical protein